MSPAQRLLEKLRGAGTRLRYSADFETLCWYGLVVYAVLGSINALLAAWAVLAYWFK